MPEIMQSDQGAQDDDSVIGNLLHNITDALTVCALE